MLNGTLPIVGRLEKMRLIGVAVTASLAVLEIERTMPGLADSKLNGKTPPPSAEVFCAAAPAHRKQSGAEDDGPQGCRRRIGRDRMHRAFFDEPSSFPARVAANFRLA